MDKTQLNKWLETAKNQSDFFDTGNRKSVKNLHIRKMASGAVWRLRWIDLSGKRHFEQLGTYPALTIEMARIAAQEFSAKLSQGIDPVKEKELVKLELTNTAQKYIDEVYLNILKSKKSGHETNLTFKRYFQDWLKIPMSEINARLVTKWQSQMIDKGLSYSTMVRSFGAFKTLLNDAVRRGYLDESPLKDITLDKIYQNEETELKRKQKRTYLTKEQVSQLMQGLDAYQDLKRQQRASSRSHGKAYLLDLTNLKYVDYVKPYILTMFYTGFRNGDINGLRWEHIQLNDRFASSIHKVIEKTAHKKPQPQNFPIPRPLVEVLKDWNEQEGCSQTGYVFHSGGGERLGKKSILKHWMKVKEFGELPKELNLYTLRHNFASWLVMNGNDLLTVAKLMGHSDIQMIIDHYGHLQPARLERAVSDSFAIMFSEDDIGSQTESRLIHQ